MVRQANRDHALREIEARLQAGAQIFKKQIQQRNQQIAEAATIISRDHAFQEAFAGANQDRLTTLSALESLQGRVKADVILISSLEHKLVFDTSRPNLTGVDFPYPSLISRAEKAESASGFVLLNDRLYAMAVSPLLAPEPIAWLCSGFQVDNEFAREIQSYTDLAITFLGSREIFATTLNQGQQTSLESMTATKETKATRKVIGLRLAGEEFLTYAVPIATEEQTVFAVLQRSLDKELAPYLRLERTYLVLALLGFAVSAAIGIWVARGVSRPVLKLAEGADQIALGNYQYRVSLKQRDELGSLASSFNEMSAGLEERDRVRDLLGKVISPEVATELLEKGLTLGGEEREVTILFSDLRNFTGMCEALTPQEMLAILNRYFTGMAAIVERHGGIVDKYVGDALMALFGAPLSHPDDAERALNAALEMVAALEELNQEWHARGLPTINLGIGINTDVVVAGNMGSESRLNYTVIGDGVNLASRLEGLTKVPEYETKIVISGSTLTKVTNKFQVRRLGEVAVRGKQTVTEIFALLGRAAPPER